MTNKHGDFIWYELLTTKPEAAQSFYGSVLGWTFASAGQGGMDYRIITMADEGVGGLMEIPSGAPMPPCWLGYIGVDDVDSAAASIKAAGGAIHMEPQDIPNVGRFAFVSDPQGVMFYVMRGWSDQPSKAFASDAPRLGHCAWNELATTDQKGALTFYTSQFGWAKDGEMDMGPMGKYEFLRHGHMVGALMTKSPDMPLPAWSFYFRVPDIDSAVQTVKEKGGQILRGPHEVPGGDWVINGLDTQGAAFSLVGQKK